jgi:hypothetical protein
MSERPSFVGELKAMAREGAVDLHNAIVPAFPDSHRGVDMQGTPLAPTSQMVYEDIQGHEYANESDREHEAMLDRYAAQSREQGNEIDGPEIDGPEIGD